jgi:hypothetical protein
VPRDRGRALRHFPAGREHARQQGRENRGRRPLTSLRAVEVAGGQPTVLGQDGVRPGDACRLGESLAAQAMTNLAERGSIGVRD